MIVALTTFIAYTIAILIKNKKVHGVWIPLSYSRTHYLWKFPLMLITWAVIAVSVFSASPSVLCGIACASIFITGLAAKYLFGDSKHDKAEYWAHMIGSYLTAGFALASMVFDHHQYLLAACVALFCVIFQFRIIKINNETFWAEFVLFLAYILIV